MKHATDTALDKLEPLLKRLRTFESLSERKRGVFYHRSRAFLHFHEDRSGLYADIRLSGDDFDRFKVETAAEREELLKAAAAVLAH